MKEFVINEKNKGQRFDKYLFRILNEAPSSFVYKMLRKKNITLNKKKADGKEIIEAGDVVNIFLSDETFDKFSKKINTKVQSFSGKASNIMKLNIIYEDDNIILINKPAGVLSQKDDSGLPSVNEFVLWHVVKNCGYTEEDLKMYKPSCVNRLDRNTSGIIVAAKNLASSQLLSKGFKERTIGKYYYAAVAGEVLNNEHLEGYIKKDDKTNKVTVKKILKSNCEMEEQLINDGFSHIETSYEKVVSTKDKSLLLVHLITGKTHQIRAHLASVNHPIIGDSKYGNREINKKYGEKYQLLHSYKIVFPKYDEVLTSISEKEFTCKPEWLDELFIIN